MPEHTPFLDAEPPHWAARGLAYVIILVFAAAAVAASVVEVPETVSSPFVLVPIRGTDPVRAVRGGMIARGLAAEGQEVAEGDVLFVIRSETAVGRTADLDALQLQKRGNAESLDAARRQFESQRRVDAEEERKTVERTASLGRMIEHKEKALAIAKQMAENYEKLAARGLASVMERSDRQLEVTRTEGEIEQLRGERQETRMALEKMRLEAETRRQEQLERERALGQEAENLGIRIAALSASPVPNEGGQYTVRAPCAGTVLAMRVKGDGTLVEEGEVLCEVGRAGEPLQAELALSRTGVGRVEPGQRIKLLYDAFPYERYGVKYGTLRWLSPASAEAESFRVLADVDDTETTVVGAERRQLMAGMGGRAEVTVGRRTLISYAFEPIRALRERLAEPPKPPNGAR
jgi:membrane fusion protein